jgi:hypothetical protein
MHVYGKTIYYLRLQWKGTHFKNSNRLNSLLLCRFIILFINFCLSLTCLLLIFATKYRLYIFT